MLLTIQCTIKEIKEFPEKIVAQKSQMMDYHSEKFSSSDLGINCLLPIINKYKLDILIHKSLYPETNNIDRYSLIMSFISLKLSKYPIQILW